MNRFLAVVTSLSALFIMGCATYSGQEPKLESATPSMVHGVKLLNGNTEKNERIFFSDGIMTFKGRYSEFTNYLISQYAKGTSNSLVDKNRSIEVTVMSISCSGSYVTNCFISASVLMGDGVKLNFNTENVYGYGPIQTASKALDQVAEMMKSDQNLNKYIFH